MGARVGSPRGPATRAARPRRPRRLVSVSASVRVRVGVRGRGRVRLRVGVGVGVGVWGRGRVRPTPNHSLRTFGVERGGGAVVCHGVCRLTEGEEAARTPA